MAYDFHELNILVVDANRTMQSLQRSVLRAFGINRVTCFTDGEEACVSLEKEPQDIAVITWLMPPINGVDFTRRVRASSEDSIKYLPIIMLTAHSDKRRVLLARDAGVTEFLAKPFTAHALYSHIASIIEHPRPFIQCDAFFGPDRRRKVQEFPSEDRRVNDPENASSATATAEHAAADSDSPGQNGTGTDG